MHDYDSICSHLEKNKYKWLITGVAGFIGSNILNKLLKLNQTVIGMDNFSTGKRKNLDDVLSANENNESTNDFFLIEGDILDYELCQNATNGVDFVLHQAALGSIPRSIANPIATHNANVNGFMNIIMASKENSVKRFVYASSSSVYGDHPDLPKKEDKIGKPLNPYAITKLINEIYAHNFSQVYGYKSIGLRYFNVFGYRQDPNGAYAAVIPKWINASIKNEEIFINGDGKTSRDFCFVDNAVQINILSALTENHEALDQIYNVALDNQTSLIELYNLIRNNINTGLKDPIYKDFREGDIRHSRADISKAKLLLGYNPLVEVEEGIKKTTNWYFDRIEK